MSSHREAPQISKDPVADSTDLYAFVSPESQTSVTLICQLHPVGATRTAAPTSTSSTTTCSTQINMDNNGDGIADVIYQFKFTTTLRDPSYFLYNVGPITSV